MSRNLAIIGASYLQLPLIEKAREMGYTTHVFAWAAGDVGEAAADHFYPVSIVEKDAIAKKCREIGICGVCSKPIHSTKRSRSFFSSAQAIR